MEPTNLRQQTSEQPLFPDLLWSRPGNKRLAGKLLIIGGNRFGFHAPAEAYQDTLSAGIGEARAVLPDAVKKVVAGFFEHALFVPSTPSGSFAQKSLPELLTASAWADGVLLPGDAGKNAETTVLLEAFLQKYSGGITLSKDVVSTFATSPKPLLDRPSTTLVVTVQQLQKLAQHSNYPHAFTFDMPLLKLAHHLQEFSHEHQAAIVLKRSSQMFVALQGEVSLTQLNQDTAMWRTKTAAHVSVWALQQSQKPFAAITCGVYEATRQSPDG